MRKISLKKALELFGGKNIEVHKGYRYRYGFFDNIQISQINIVKN